MRRIWTGAATLALLCAYATGVSAQITGSAHDFNGDAWNATGEICAVCHTPHNANNAVTASAPLWNHDLSALTYTAYGSGYDMQSTTFNITGTSQICLSCHDGSVALENFGGNTAGTTTLMAAVNANADLGNDLTNDHPVGMAYDVADTELRATTAAFGTGTIADVLGAGGTVECSSCHDVHNTNTGPNHLLRLDNASSALCLACHNK